MFDALSLMKDQEAQIAKMREQIENTKSCKLCKRNYDCNPYAEQGTSEYEIFAGCHGSMKDNWEWKGTSCEYD